MSVEWLALLAGGLGGLLGGSAAALVAVLILPRVSPRWQGASLAFSGGFVLSVAFLELIGRGLERAEGTSTLLVAAAVALGAGLRAASTWLASNVRTDLGEQTDEYRLWQARKLAGTLALENILEGLSIGVAFAVEVQLGVLLAIVLAIDTFVEGLLVSAELAGTKAEVRRVLLLVVGPSPLLGFGALLGAYVGGLSQTLLAVALGSAAGVILHAFVDDIFYDAHRMGSGAAISLPLIGGVVLGILSTAFA